MSESRPICPLLEGYLVGDPISEHNGIQCCPAVDPESNERYFVKIISFPPSKTQLDAMLITGALKDEDEANKYYRDRTADVIRQIEILQQLARQEGFLPYAGFQAVDSEDGIGQKIFILSHYKRTLLRQFAKKPLTHLDALNLSLDICSALTACRRSGFLYANLKPSNIYITPNGEYKINDHSFLRLDTLKYAALDEHCISSYTAPEITDAYSSVNDTLDVYAMGMILYEIFNGGRLPEDKLLSFPAPEYADEEISGIILKACNPDPSQRWKDPMQMGQALVSYMQKNGVHDTPIVPPAPVPEPEPIPEIEPEPVAISLSDAELLTASDSISDKADNQETLFCEEISDVNDTPNSVDTIAIDEIKEETLQDDSANAPEIANTVSDTAAASLASPISPDIPEVNDIIEQPVTDVASFKEGESDNTPVVPEFEEPAPADCTEAAIIQRETEDNENEIYEILQSHDDFSDEVAEIRAAAAYLDIDHIDEPPADISYEDISDEVVQILSQADALATMDVPEPVVAPEEIEIKLPEAVTISENIQSSETETELTEEEDDMKSNKHTYADDSTDKKPLSAHWIRNIILIAILLILLLGGFLFYQFFMLETVTDLQLSGNKDSLIVQFDCAADESLLSVSCEEKYGKITIVPVKQGIEENQFVAEFTGLKPDMDYTVRIDIAGLHVLKGETEETYYTPKETTIVSYNVNTGTELGTAELSFIVEGPNSNRWSLKYSTPGYPWKTISFEGNSVLLTDLLPNKSYTGFLEPEDDLFITDTIQIDFTATEIIEAKNLRITSCNGGKLTAEWDAPETFQVDNWIVQCYSGKNGASYNQTVTTNKTSYEFKGLNSAESFTVIVTAEGQSSPQTATIGANSVTVTDLTTDTSIAGVVNLTWHSSATPASGWIVTYTVNGSSEMQTFASDKEILINPVVPNAEYTFTVQSADAVQTFCETVTCKTKATDIFSISINNEIISAEDLQFSMIKQLDGADWSHIDLSESDYTETFADGERAGFVVFLKKEFEESSDDFNATFVICNDKGEIVSISSREAVWNSVWHSNYCILKIPTLPKEAGFYTVTVYLNSQFAVEKGFTIQ